LGSTSPVGDREVAGEGASLMQSCEGNSEASIDLTQSLSGCLGSSLDWRYDDSSSAPRHLSPANLSSSRPESSHVSLGRQDAYAFQSFGSPSPVDTTFGMDWTARSPTILSSSSSLSLFAEEFSVSCGQV